MDEQRSQPGNLQRLFLHLPEGDRLYVCIVDEQRRAFDFTDNTFKGGNKLAHVRDACLPATGHDEPRADHEYSYRVEIDLSRLLKGTNPETAPAEGAKVTVHWLRQVGDEPDLSADTQLTNTVSLQNVGGRFQPADKWDADRLDENCEFEKRAKYQAEYRDFVQREIDTLDARRARLATAVRSGSVAGVLRVLAEDICNWAGNLKQHFLHQISHLAKDPSFVSSRMVPKDAPFQIYETWVVRDWIGSHEAYDLLEFHKSADFARSFSVRVNKLHEARVEFSRNVVDYTVQTRGEDVEGVIALDEARKELKHRALCLAEYLDVIALQFEAADEAQSSQECRAEANADERFRRDDRPQTSTSWQGGIAGGSTSSATENAAKTDEPRIEPASDEILRSALPLAVMSALGLRDLGRVRQYYPNVIPAAEAKFLHEGFATNLKSAAEICKLERVLKIGTIPTFEEGGSDTELSAMMGGLALWHPDVKLAPSSSDADITKRLETAISKCQADVTEPVRGMIERVINAMLFDCRVPSPKGDPSFQEPQRSLQMLRSYWSVVRGLVLHHIEAPVGYRPHPLMPVILNLKARMEACFDQLAQLNACDDARQQVATLVDIVLSGEPDDLQAAPEWSYDQVGSVDRFIEEGRLALGAKTYPLTPAEEMCLKHFKDEVDEYVANVKAQWDRMLKRIDAKRDESARPNEKSSTESVPSESPTQQLPAQVREPQQFSGGEIVFFEDRVEICGVDVCSGPRSGSRRVVLELLSRRKNGTTFVAYSGVELESQAKQKGAKGTAAGWIRDLRDDIIAALRTQANIISGHRDVILSGGSGYRFSECLTVRCDSAAAIKDITDTAEEADVRDDDVRDVFDVRDDETARRREWIIQQLQEGVRLKAPMVATQFTRAKKTAQRDLDALRDEGTIEFVGDPRTGFYRLRQRSDGGKCAAPPSL